MQRPPPGDQVCGALEEQGVGKAARSHGMSRWKDDTPNI